MSIDASDSFTFTKAGVSGFEAIAANTSRDFDWSVSGWEDPAVASLEAKVELPDGYALSAVYPNPFNPQARFTLDLAETQRVNVAVFDMLGRRVTSLHDGTLDAGAHTFVLGAAGLPTGTYVIRVTGDTFMASRRATLVR